MFPYLDSLLYNRQLSFLVSSGHFCALKTGLKVTIFLYVLNLAWLFHKSACVGTADASSVMGTCGHLSLTWTEGKLGLTFFGIILLRNKGINFWLRLIDLFENRVNQNRELPGGRIWRETSPRKRDQKTKSDLFDKNSLIKRDLSQQWSKTALD